MAGMAIRRSCSIRRMRTEEVMVDRDDRLREVLREYQDAGDVAVAVILRENGEYSYAGPEN